jgi:hypothetical protein
MAKKGLLTKILAVLGTVFVWLPVLSPVFFSLGFSIRRGFFRFDYLMPAEFFPLALLGGILLLVAAFLARSRQGLVGWGLGTAVLMLVGSQALAVVTGLASGETEPTGLPWALVVTALVIYVLALVVMGIGGALLLRDLFKSKKAEPATSV